MNVKSKPFMRYLALAPEVEAALHDRAPVVALESTIISHGMPYPQNVETAAAVEAAVREAGAIPATIAVIAGRLKVGLDSEEIHRLGVSGSDTVKCSRRDLPVVVTRQADGATTVAATMIVAAMAGIRIFATGGIGGVHRGASDSYDVSADLEELARTSCAVVCAGAKSVLDIGKTLEYLETHGVPVLGFGCDTLPAFYTRDSGFLIENRVDTALEAADIMRNKWAMGLAGGLVVAVPAPAEYALDNSEVDTVIETAIEQMQHLEISGKAATPFLLARIAEATDGRSLATNQALVINNARVAADIAVAYWRE